MTVLPDISKIMEAVVSEQLLSHKESKDFIAAAQHGFRPGQSCITNLILARYDWTSAVNAGSDVDAVFLDFSKAFDHVRHDLLLQKLRLCGVGENCLSWIHSFLQGWKASVSQKNALTLSSY